MSNVLGILVSCLYCKWSLEMMDEHQHNWKEMALTIKRQTQTHKNTEPQTHTQTHTQRHTH